MALSHTETPDQKKLDKNPKTILERIYEKAEKIPAKTTEEKALSATNVLKKISQYLDIESFSSLWSTNLTLFSYTRFNDFIPKDYYTVDSKKFVNLDARHIRANRGKSGVIIQYKNENTELLSGDLKRTLACKPKYPQQDFLYILQIALTGNTSILKDYIKHHNITTQNFSQKKAFLLLNDSVSSGEIALVEFVLAWLGDFQNFHQDDEKEIDVCVPYICDRNGDSKESKTAEINHWINMNYLIQPAISSGRIDMIDYIIKHFVDDRLSQVSPYFALVCLKETVSTKNMNLINKVLLEPKLKCLFKLANNIGILDYYQGSHYLVRALKYFLQHEDEEVMRNIHTHFLKYNKIEIHTQVILYLGCVSRNDDFRQSMIQLFKLMNLESNSHALESIVGECIYSQQHILNIINDFKTTKHIIVDMATKKGCINTLKQALFVWRLPANSISILYCAAESRSVEVFAFVIQYLERQTDFDWNKVDWKTVIWNAVSKESEGEQKSGILDSIYDYLLHKCRYNHKIIADLFLISIKTYYIEHVLIIRFMVEKLGLKEKITLQEWDSFDLMQVALKNRRFDSIKYLVISANYDVVRYSDRIISILLNKDLFREEIRNYIQDGIFEFLLGQGLPLSLQQLDEYKQRYKIAFSEVCFFKDTEEFQVEWKIWEDKFSAWAKIISDNDNDKNRRTLKSL